jgi:hypothetical protein
MFDKFRKAIADVGAKVTAAAKLPPDLMAVPAVNARPFGEVDVATLSTYLGRTVASITPLGPLGAQATSLLGERLQDRLRQAGGGTEPGELIAGQNAAREARMRAEGATEEQLAMIRERFAAHTAQHVKDGWDVVFDDGDRASVQLFPKGSEAWDDFDRFEARWDSENGTDGHRPEHHATLASLHHRYTKSPYESYEYKRRLIARNATHAAVVQSSKVADWTMVGLAAVALRTTEP